jgi:wyosine [tRNA(Phe)-imidazoG37] synthetase (radical SAM superfamily)
MANRLTVLDHSRDSAAMRYVYPVVSRRAGGVSIGINLNTDNACNWRCIYCQVPDLKLGNAPAVDLLLLEIELRDFLQELLHGDFMQVRVPPEVQRINDFAISGNGEPTSAAEFLAVVELLVKIKQSFPELPDGLKLVLITNGSLLYRPQVQQALKLMAQHHGEVWFKLDRASESGMIKVNNTQLKLHKVRENLLDAIECCPNTWLQTCWFALDGEAPTAQDETDYLSLLESLRQVSRLPQGVLLYGLARVSCQSEAPRLYALKEAQLEVFAERIRQLGLIVKVSV